MHVSNGYRPWDIRNLPEAKKDVGGYLMDYYDRQRPHIFNDDFKEEMRKSPLRHHLSDDYREIIKRNRRAMKKGEK